MRRTASGPHLGEGPWSLRGHLGTEVAAWSQPTSTGWGAGPSLRCRVRGAPHSEGSASGRRGHWPGNKQASEGYQGVDQRGTTLPGRHQCPVATSGVRPSVQALCAEPGRRTDVAAGGGWAPLAGSEFTRREYIHVCLVKPASVGLCRVTLVLRGHQQPHHASAGWEGRWQSPSVGFVFDRVCFMFDLVDRQCTHRVGHLKGTRVDLYDEFDCHRGCHLTVTETRRMLLSLARERLE